MCRHERGHVAADADGIRVRWVEVLGALGGPADENLRACSLHADCGFRRGESRWVQWNRRRPLAAVDSDVGIASMLRTPSAERRCPFPVPETAPLGRSRICGCGASPKATWMAARARR